MMATKPRTDQDTATSAPTPVVERRPPPATSAEAIQDLERRLMGLGTGDQEEEASPAPVSAPAPALDLLSDPATASASAPAPSADAATATAFKPAAPVSGGGKSALLARIMAAQERAKAAQEQQQALDAQLAARDRKRHIMKALEGKEDAEDDSPPPFELAQKEAPLPPPAFDSVQSSLPPIAASAAAPPPFEAVESSLPPPAFDSVEQNLPPSFDLLGDSLPPPAAVPPSAQLAAPSAPSFDLHHEDEKPAAAAVGGELLDGFENILAPPSSSATAGASAPPTFEQIENQLDEQLMDDEAFLLDEDGKPMSAEARKKMMEEQRAIMAAIQKEAADNAAAIAAAQAEDFELRSGRAVAQVAGGTGGPPPREAERAALVGHEDAAVGQGANVDRTVEIGGGQNVALHGQERTKKAIADGTAILVECMNCNNWMQVTESATLMFCPVCSVVSPVQKQSEVITKEKAIQLTRDRQLAERLQAEINAELDGRHRARTGGASATAHDSGESGSYMPSFLSGLMGETRPEQQRLTQSGSTSSTSSSSKSWWDTISEYVSVGVASQEHQRGSIGVSRPPGSSATTERMSPSNYERRGLLDASVDRSGMGSASYPSRSMPAARVAESRPLFSCIADSISSAASAMGEMAATTMSQDGEGNVHGVDSSNLLVTRAGREGGGGNYHQLSDQDS